MCMIPIIMHDRCALFHGNSAKLASVLGPNTVDAIVTDPPAGIAFMGADWDKDKGGRDAWIDWLATTLADAFAALKPGAYALVWALPRTSHWTAMALEDCGFEIRDVHHHIFGTGFPKSLDLGNGVGTAFKPAVEHWILARKPLEGTYAQNRRAYGTGGLNIDACRIGTEARVNPERPAAGGFFNIGTVNTDAPKVERACVGRWPAHLSLEHAPCCSEQCVIGCPVRLLDEQSGLAKAQKARDAMTEGKTTAPVEFVSGVKTKHQFTPKDNGGGASRFFYVAKGSRSEKDGGLEHLTPKTGGEATGREDDSIGTQNPRAGAGRTGGARNFHPTVKSIDLMRWLIRLITPPGGVVLDIFAGSGTTGIAALAEGCDFIGVEQGGKDGEYIPIIEGRLRHALSEYADTAERT